MKQVLNDEKGEQWWVIDGMVMARGKVFVPT
jgi:hypothetical protein